MRCGEYQLGMRNRRVDFEFQSRLEHSLMHKKDMDPYLLPPPVMGEITDQTGSYSLVW